MKQAPSFTDRRSAILSAALGCFLAKGYTATSIADIRAASGASTGSIYHFFSGKGALALALVQRAVAGWSMASSVDPAAAAEVQIKASVSGLVAWGLGHRDEARFLDEVRTLALGDPTLADLARLLAAGQTAARDRYAALAARGEVRQLPWELAHALMLGPAYDFLRLAPPDAGRASARLLADAAWAAVRQAP